MACAMDGRSRGRQLPFVDLHEILANDEHAVALTNVTMKQRDMGSLTMRSMWIFHCSGGKVTEGWFFDENPAAASAFWS